MIASLFAPTFTPLGKTIIVSSFLNSRETSLKGFKIGNAKISDVHGNYIVNAGGAKSSDLIQLIYHIQKTVFDATGILLEPEVRIVQRP